MQMPASVSKRGVSQEWQTEHEGQDERLEGLREALNAMQGIWTFSGGQ